MGIETLNHITGIFTAHSVALYSLIALGMIIEGDFVLILAGVAAHLGFVSFGGALTASLVGVAIKSVIGYAIGVRLKRHNIGRGLLHRIECNVVQFLPRIKDKPFWSLLTSKFLYGFVLITYFSLIFIGYIGTPFGVYFAADMVASLIWVLIMLILGYSFSVTALNMTQDIKEFGGLIFLLIVVVFGIQYVYSKIMKKKLATRIAKECINDQSEHTSTS